MSTYDQQFHYGFESDQQPNLGEKSLKKVKKIHDNKCWHIKIEFLLEFQNFDSIYTYNTEYPATPTTHFNNPSIFTPSYDHPEVHQKTSSGYDDELPLLEELEIFPHRIMQKSLAVLNPFHKKGLADDAEFLFRDTDLAGPIAFFLALAFCLFLSNTRNDIFGYVYGLSIITVMFMYVLMRLMSTSVSETQNYITVASVASILGYSILPIVWLSIPGIFFTLNNKIGILLAIAAIFMSTSASSRIFCLMTGDANQRFLIAYPCALVYVIFSLLVLF